MCPAECDNTTKSQHCSTRLPWPEEKKGGTIFSYFHRMYQRWTFSYMNLIFSRNSGDRQSKLVQEDLFGVPSAMRADVLKERFSGKYKECSRHKILNTMWHVASPTLVPAGFCELITVACQVSMPLLVRELLSLVENNPSGDIARKGFPFALSIFAVMVVNAFGNHRHRHLALKSGVAMRAALVSALYDHILDLSPLGRTGLKSGEIANLVAVDTQKLFDVAQDFHLIWALPLSIIVVTIFLVIVMGPVTLIGIAVLVLLVPVVERVTSKMLKVRQKRVSITDERVGVVNSMLQGIKVTKLGNYERNYETRILDIRKNELRELKVELAIWALTLVIVVISPILASSATFAAYVLIDDKNILTASDTFSVLLLFSALRFPINYAGQLAGKAVQAFSAMYRIRLFLEREAQTLSSFSTDDNEQALTSSVHPLTVRNASFSPVGGVDDGTGVEDSLQAGKETFSVSMFDFSVRKGEILAVYGPVASGKSTLINGILGEAKRLEGDVSIHGRIAVVPQSPFILNASFRDNILFGREFDSSLYEQVIQSCCLVADIQQLGESADQTEIGERGVTLSGGQKQRISIARAAYAQPDLVLLDDPLSALDATVSSIVFENVLKSPNALFRDTAVVLVTHASHFLSRVDNVLVIAEGKNAFIGTWKDLATFQPADPKVKDVVKFLRSSLQEQVGDDRNAESLVVMRGENEMVSHKLMSEEEREHGLSSLMVWTLWFRRAGGYWFLSTQVFFMAIDRFAYVATEYWLAKWTQGASKEVSMAGISFPPQTDGKSAQYKFLLVYSILILVSILTTLIRSEWAVTGGAKAAKTVFSSMLTGVLRAPMSYFEQTPMGRILNRFTYDVDVVDVSLTQSMSMFMISCSWYIAGVIVMCTILPWSALAIFPVTSLYWLLMLHYRRTGADLQRLDAVSRSPIQAMVNEGVEGSTTIRAFRKQPEFIEKFRRATDDNSSALLNFVSAQRWLGLRIELLGSMVVLTSSMAVVLFNSTFKIEPGLVGLLIMWSSNFTITLGFLVDTFSATEAAITAIERVDAMAKVPSEKAMETLEPFIPPEDWPRSGKLCFENVCLRYRDGLPLALNELTFTVQGGTRCGIVGRTGAGKSSITVALFRIAEIESGRITLDGLDLGLLGLCDVRGRQNGMTIIPQDPFLTGSTLRECIDPFRAFSDSDVLNALQTVRLVTSHATIEVLGTRVEEGGSNYSVGERQLMNIAHALLSKPRILVLDEATASVDGETDAFIQGMLRTKFPSSTLLTVAHRLHTVMDYDTIIVMKDGRSVEEGHPAELLSRRGAFADLVNATGEENAKALRALIGHSSSGI